MFNRKYIFKGPIFYCYFRLPEFKLNFLLTMKTNDRNKIVYEKATVSRFLLKKGSVAYSAFLLPLWCGRSKANTWQRSFRIDVMKRYAKWLPRGSMYGIFTYMNGKYTMHWSYGFVLWFCHVFCWFQFIMILRRERLPLVWNENLRRCYPEIMYPLTKLDLFWKRQIQHNLL